MARALLRSAVPILWQRHEFQSRDQVPDRPTPVAEIERRTHPRVTVALPCYCVVARTRTAVARTVNISRTGILLAWNDAGNIPKLGGALRVDIVLPPAGPSQKCIRCCGRVVRVHLAKNEEPSIAVDVAQMEFRDYAPAAARVDGGLK